MMKKSHFLTVLSMIGLLASMSSFATAAQPAIYPVEPSEIRAAAQNATTRSDHEAVAKYYEDAAIQMQAKVKEQKDLLDQYENKSYLYGRQAQDLQANTDALIRKLEYTVKTNIQEAALHRQMASKLQGNHAASSAQRLSAVDGL